MASIALIVALISAAGAARRQVGSALRLAFLVLGWLILPFKAPDYFFWTVGCFS
jgi:hypothetical protein